MRYICGGNKFNTLTEAMEYANGVFNREGIILGIEYV